MIWARDQMRKLNEVHVSAWAAFSMLDIVRADLHIVKRATFRLFWPRRPEGMTYPRSAWGAPRLSLP